MLPIIFGLNFFKQLDFYFILFHIHFSKISAQALTLIMYAAISLCYTQTAIMKRTSQSENCMHN